MASRAVYADGTLGDLEKSRLGECSNQSPAIDLLPDSGRDRRARSRQSPRMPAWLNSFRSRVGAEAHALLSSRGSGRPESSRDYLATHFAVTTSNPHMPPALTAGSLNIMAVFGYFLIGIRPTTYELATDWAPLLFACDAIGHRDFQRALVLQVDV